MTSRFDDFFVQTHKRAIILNFNNLLLFIIFDGARFLFSAVNIFVTDAYKKSTTTVTKLTSN